MLGLNHDQDIRYYQVIIHVTVELKTNVSEAYCASIICVRLNIIIQNSCRKMKEYWSLILVLLDERLQKDRSFLFTVHVSLLVNVVAVSLIWCNCNVHIFSVTFQIWYVLGSLTRPNQGGERNHIWRVQSFLSIP